MKTNQYKEQTMKQKQSQKQPIDKIKFSIGAKLIIIITILVLISLGSITALVSWMVREDLKIAAEEYNFESNRRSASEAEDLLVNMRSYSRILMQMANTMGENNAQVQVSVEYFFEQNPNAAALVFSQQGQQRTFVNNTYFTARGLDSALANTYFNENLTALRRAAAGETIAFNATPYFDRSLIAMFFPWQNGGGGVLFSPDKLNDSFGFGTNKSYLINDMGDVLIHPDYEMLASGTNLASDNIIRSIFNRTEKHRQTIAETEDGIRYYTAFSKLDIGGCIVITSVEYDKVFEGVTATTRRNIYLTFAVLFFSIMFIWFFSKSISVPLKTLAAAARKIEGGDFKLDLKSKSGDEIGLLGRSFQRMSSALNIFGRFTNREIAVRAMRGEIKPGGLPKHATIFFSDIRGFTEKSENMTRLFKNDASDKIVFWLNNYLSRMVECVEKTDGVVDKFIGDAVMAHWGTAYTSGSPVVDAFNCVRAALMMRFEVYNINKNRANQNDPGTPIIQIGCGINTGIVTAGQIGSDLRMEYTVIGDPVNLASRVESLNKPLGTDILITEDTWKLAGQHFITEEMPAVTVKGKEKPVRIFAVINFKNAKSGPKTLAEVRKHMGIEAPDISKTDINTDEIKYNIGKTKSNHGKK